MPIELPPLPFPKNSLAPHISEETIDFHYGKHHAGYVTKLNGLIQGTNFANSDLTEIVLNSEGAIYNNAAQIWNHTFYWNSLSPNGGGAPNGPIAEAIHSTFGSFENFREQFNTVAGGHFGSGWAWLIKNNQGQLEILGSHDAGNPLRMGAGVPILTCDVWEHAYYIDYRNNRLSYLNSWWNIVNWDFANANFTA